MTQIIKEQWLQDLKAAIDDDCPNLVSLYDGFHYLVVYVYSSAHIFMMNPSLVSMGSILNAVPKRRFARIWNKWAIVVNG